MPQIESRIGRLENRLGVNQPAETIDEMVEKFNCKKYGPETVMSLVCGAVHAKDLGGYIESLQFRYPGPLIDCFVDGLTLAMQRTKQGEGLRDRRSDESRADYFKYQINECFLIVG